MKGGTILLVEDDPDDEQLTLRALKKSNIKNKVEVAHDGVEALDYLLGRGAYEGRDLSDLPAVVLMDINLPKLDGLEVVKRLRADGRTKLVPIVMLTSSSEEEDIIKSYKLGANSYVRKPVDFAEFLEAVRILGIFWLMTNQPPPEHHTA